MPYHISIVLALSCELVICRCVFLNLHFEIKYPDTCAHGVGFEAAVK